MHQRINVWFTVVCLAFFGLGETIVLAQTGGSDVGTAACGTAAAPASVLEYIEGLRRDGLLDAEVRTENALPVIYLPMQIHLLADNNGAGRYPLSTFTTVLCELNQKFRTTGIQFYWKGQPNYINNSAWYNLPNFSVVDQINTQYNVAGSINVYFLSLSAMSLCGFAYYPGTGSPAQTNRQGAIYMALGCSNPGNSTFAHEMGHFLSLPHPFDQTSGNPQATWAERVTRNPNEIAPRLPSNCATAGDRFCDTPADFRDARWNCPSGGGSALDINGDLFQPLGRLFMSYANDACQDSFTVEQKAAMRSTVTATGPRSYLLTPPMPTYDTVVGTPVMHEPLNQTYGLPVNYLRFRWGSVPGATQYVLRIRWFTTPAQEFLVSDTQFLYTGGGQLLSNKVYRWSVQALNPRSVCAPFSTEWFFGTASSAVHLGSAVKCPGDTVQLEVLHSDLTGVQSGRLKLDLPLGMMRYSSFQAVNAQAMGLQVTAYPSSASSALYTDSLVIAWNNPSAVNWTGGPLLRLRLVLPVGVNWPSGGLQPAWDTLTGNCRISGSWGQRLPVIYFSGQITAGTCNALDGRLVYDNNAQTPMAGTTVRVRDPLLVLVGNSVCDANGAFGWNSLPATTVTPEWTYVVNWGGVNATDALLVSRTFANLMSLTGLRAVAADVNANGVVNNTDALLISRRVSGLGGAFAGGDWVQDQPGPWLANIPGVPGLVRTLCKGDVNGSYTPVPGP